ncbi:MAG: hypothetical protein H0X33_08980 [Taibaiella sp.]|nr:hypothetical protein [Taibaiella sp.]
MSSQDIKIGNNVYVDGSVVEVVAINNKDEEQVIITVKMQDGLLNSGTQRALNLEPIKLSKDVLQRCCAQDARGLIKTTVQDRVFFFKMEKDYMILMDEHKFTLIHFWEVNYLHQFQNLYYSMTGICLLCPAEINQE